MLETLEDAISAILRAWRKHNCAALISRNKHLLIERIHDADDLSPELRGGRLPGQTAEKIFHCGPGFQIGSFRARPFR